MSGRTEAGPPDAAADASVQPTPPPPDAATTATLPLPPPADASSQPPPAPQPRAPASFYCPISMELMADPVMVATGHTYDRPCIERWLAQGHGTCPVTGARLRHLELTPNFALRDAVGEWAAGVGRAVPARPDGAPRTNAATLFKGGSGGAPSGGGGGRAAARAAAAAALAAAVASSTPSGDAATTTDSPSLPPAPLPSILHGHDEIVWAVDAPADGGGPGAGPAGRLFSASADRTVRVWDVASRRCEAVLEGHARPVLCLATASMAGTPAGEDGAAAATATTPADGLGGCAGGGALFSGSYDHTIRAWSLARLARAASLTGHTDAVRALLLGPSSSPAGGRLFSASYDSTVRVWDPATGACIATLVGHTGPVRTLAAGAGGLIFSGSYDGSVRAWDARAPTGGAGLGGPACAAVLTGHASAVRALAAAAPTAGDGGGSLVFSGSDDATIRAWDVRGLRCVATLAGHDDNVRVLAAGPAGRPGASPSAAGGSRSLLFSGSWDRTIRAWRCDTLACERVLAGHTEAVLALAVGDGVLASGSYDASVRLWDLATLRPGPVCGGHGDAVRVLAARGRTVFSGSYDGSVGVWEAGPTMAVGGGGGGGADGRASGEGGGGRGSTALV